MKYDFDYIIIGSGFGGSVSALRLAQKGFDVLVVEKGKWYRADDFAKSNWDLRKWLWMPFIRFFGIMKMSIFRHVVVISGTGVGGGSLVYANTLPVPKSTFFKTGSWSGLAQWEDELEPFYNIALKMLGANKNPRLFDGDIALKTLAEEIGRPSEFIHTDVAVFFGKEGVEVEDPYFEGEGPKRAGCIYCGGCMTGCRHNAKNTLDKNYLYLAQKSGAEILAEHEVIDVVKFNGHEDMEYKDSESGYKVTLKSSTRFFKKNRKITSKGVIFSGGVLGTLKLLLKLKRKSLPQLSDKLGHDIRTNNETLISVSTLDKSKDVSKGVAIGSLLHTDENSHLEVVRYAEGSGFWKWVHLPYATGKNVLVRIGRMLGAIIKAPLAYFKIYWVNSWSKHTVVLLFMQTIDSTLRLKRGLFGNMITAIGRGVKPTPFIPESTALTDKYARIIGGKPTSFVLETMAGIPSTAHILGGAVMGNDATKGVIDKNNNVFGYQNMLIIDGSMISANPGVNPALSITAIAERAMSHIPRKNSD